MFAVIFKYHCIESWVQIRGFIDINSARRAIAAAAKLLRRARDLHLPPMVLKGLESRQIYELVSGLQSAVLPLWKLDCLLDEAWLEEDAMDAIAEIAYFRIGAQTMADLRAMEPSFLYLPTSFFTDACFLYSNSTLGRRYSGNLMALRERLVNTDIRWVSWVVCDGQHYISYVYDVQQGTLEYGDSSHGPPDNEVLEVWRWILDGTGHPKPNQLDAGTIERQMSRAGSGSCGVAAHNFIVSKVDRSLPLWQPEHSQQHRDGHLRDILMTNVSSCSRACNRSKSDFFRCFITLLT